MRITARESARARSPRSAHSLVPVYRNLSPLQVLSRSLAQLSREWADRIAANFDAISLHVCICLCDKFHALLKQRSVPALSQLVFVFDFLFFL